jgi:flagellar basal body-associated protein FliL
MTLLLIIILAVILLVAGLYAIKLSGSKRKAEIRHAAESAHTSAPNVNKGSIPDASGTKGDGNSALSSGKQG